jgi:hypothetical protein
MLAIVYSAPYAVPGLVVGGWACALARAGVATEAADELSH